VIWGDHVLWPINQLFSFTILRCVIDVIDVIGTLHVGVLVVRHASCGESIHSSRQYGLVGETLA